MGAEKLPPVVQKCLAALRDMAKLECEYIAWASDPAACEAARCPACTAKTLVAELDREGL